MGHGKAYEYFSSDSSVADADKFIAFFGTSAAQKSYLKRMAVGAMGTSTSLSVVTITQ